MFSQGCSFLFSNERRFFFPFEEFSSLIKRLAFSGTNIALSLRSLDSNNKKGRAMSLTLEHVSRTVEGQTWIDDANLSFEPGSFNVLLGRTLSGKTSLMRLMAGLDKPDSGRILMNGVDVTQRPVRLRNVSMVYQQFINYPTMTVFENIASPLRQGGVSNELIQSKVLETAKMLRIEKFLQRYPLELSGGQQQRTAMARALVKDAELILFDEPLVNLDYKLREELRQEMRELFKNASHHRHLRHHRTQRSPGPGRHHDHSP